VLQVWDSDEERDELIGQCTVNFYDMPKAVRQERWCTITPEGYKSTRAVEAKTENTNAGQVLVALTLDFAHEFDMETDGAEAVGPVQTVVTRKWGQLADVPELEYTGREDLRVRHVRQLLRDKLALLQRGVNFSVRPALHGAIATLINAVKYQQEGELFQAREQMDAALREAGRQLNSKSSSSEDLALASKARDPCQPPLLPVSKGACDCFSKQVISVWSLSLSLSLSVRFSRRCSWPRRRSASRMSRAPSRARASGSWSACFLRSARR